MTEREVSPPTRLGAVVGPRPLVTVLERGARGQIRLLGPVEFSYGGVAVSMSCKERRILALLTLRRPRRVSEDDLIDGLWPDGPPRTARRTLHGYVCRLRRGLRCDPEIGIERSYCGYRLDAPVGRTDLDEVEALYRLGRDAVDRGDPRLAARLLAQADGFWCGDSLGEFGAEAFAAGEANRLEELRVSMAELRYESELDAGRHGPIIPELERLSRAHPTRERLWSARMTALYRSGRQTEALQVYQALRSHLVTNVGIEPSPRLRALEMAVLQQDVTLEWSACGAGSRWPTAPSEWAV